LSKLRDKSFSQTFPPKKLSQKMTKFVQERYGDGGEEKQYEKR
jgi:hypothetical protein